MERKKVFNYLINLSFFLYFIILITERLISIILSINNKVNLYGSFFNGYTYTLVFLSIVAFIIYLIIFCRKNIKALFKYNDTLDYFHISIASGILLLAGMVHTSYTIPAIQFVSYGILIIGILLKVILLNEKSNNKALLWLSFLYLVAFSMAIPVMYESNIKRALIFHIVEAFGSFILVSAFTVLLISLFKGDDDLFNIWSILTALIIDIFIIGMRWNEKINVFVLIFISLSFVLFVIGYVYKRFKKEEIEE